MTSDWRDRIVGARMTVDDKYASTIDNSQFSRQEWGLVMTAVEFDIEHAANESEARLVADTSSLPDVIPELDRVREAQQMGAGGGGSRGDSGVLGTVKDALGLGGGGDGMDEEKLRAAEDLVDGYARELQTHLEERGRWQEIRAAATED